MPTQLGTLLNANDVEWVGVLHAVAPHFLSGYVDETVRNRILLAYLRKNGRIMLNQSGEQCVWNVKFDQAQVESAGDGGTVQFNRNQLMRRAAINWRGYLTTDMMTEKEYLMCKGPAQIFDRYGDIIPSLMEAMTDNFGAELILDGNATGRDNNIHGLESFLAHDTDVAATDLIATPNDSYAGLSTVLANQGGTWSSNLASNQRPNGTDSHASDWPSGKGSVSYDFYSPKLVNWASSGWGTGVSGSTLQAWEANCERAIRQLVIWLIHTGGQRSKPKVIMLSQDLYNGYLNHQATKGRIILPHKESEDLGFGDTVNQEGVAITYDYDVPTLTGYACNVENMELASLDKVLFGYRGPEWSIKDRAYLFYVGMFGNTRFRPKHFGKLYPYA
jgi:hypothetical protein